MSAIGHGIAYGTGAVDLPSIFGTTFGDTQFKQLTIAAAFGVVTTCAITSWAVTERVLVDVKRDSRKQGGILKVISQIWSTILHLPPRIRAICMAQFWSWIGWFPFLFYSTTWVSVPGFPRYRQISVSSSSCQIVLTTPSGIYSLSRAMSFAAGVYCEQVLTSSSNR